jgi:hypothetical protein
MTSTRSIADTIIVCMSKGKHRFCFLFDDTKHGRELAIDQAIVWAADRRLSLTWTDAVKLCRQIRESERR